ncbi:hypothetical protein COJ85_03590 [Bacillus sp. AFS076308]|uniref:DUF3231 family protein n=1 Tax=unclassified Bacillus (in: firmicutes) TaxID=185979 RepID=UPI000BF94F5C|nr:MULTISPECIES: DUF3231 family protein [unclassified Bacillus (in: firmicutes)]PFO08337.1 hypothetical protein COJ85_03590 [Bacillus sp. AFS076308]PGV50653.1 hypothetical protein COD92_17100 [Bacillus sp. AFS037270]
MEDQSEIRLTAAEMAVLWSQYINDTSVICMNNHFLEKSTDPEVRTIIEFTLSVAKSNIEFLQGFFKNEDFPIPFGFTEKDVLPEAPKLFSDTFVLMYLRQMSILAMAASSAALGLATREDVVAFHKKVLQAAVKAQDLTRRLMLKQGTYIRPPFISTPDKVDFVEKQQFLNGFFGKKRALTVVEITHLFMNVQTNAIGKALITGFGQIAKSEEVKQYLKRGKQIAQKHMDIFSGFLIKEDLPAPMSWDAAVLDSTSSIFSDKLMMFLTSAMIAAGVGNYGMGMAASPRKDLGFQYASLIPEIALYAEDGANIMIKNGWMEEPPQADDKDQLMDS